MLKQLSIKNFALIQSVELSFGTGLNIITGETGAGKSIIVDALMLVLGERASADDVRHGEQKAVVEGIFSIRGNTAIGAVLEREGYEGDGEELIIRRELAAKGSSRSFVNDSPAPVALVKELGDLLVDFHGQHQHQSLLRADSHIGMLDNVGSLGRVRDEYYAEYQKLHAIHERLRDLTSREKSLREQQELRRFQLKEIQEVDPQPDEERNLEEELAIISNAEQLHDSTHQLHAMLYEDDGSIRDRMLQARKILEELSGIDRVFADYLDECRSAIVTVEEIAKFAQNYASKIEFQPARIEFIRERLRVLSRLRKKYGTLEEAIESRTKFEEELALVENFEEEIQRLKASIGEQERVLGGVAQQLSLRRHETAAGIEKSVEATLATLGIAKARFRVMFGQELFSAGKNGSTPMLAEIGGKKFLATPNGVDRVEFYITTNAGEEPRPLAKIASGGEISRVMLAMKSILAKSDRLPMLVFDEIDVGISGRISQKVGLAMKSLAAYHQIISITHAPQIAALADYHISVEKKEANGKAFINARPLGQEERTREVAKLLSGENISEAALQSAQELMLVKE